MHTLRMLGGITLTDARGGELDALLRQQKHLALLAYLAMPRPGTWHRRDSLLVVFWPDLDHAKGRTALRQALRVLRGHLIDGAIRTRGDGEVSLNPAIVSTDVEAVADDLAAGRCEQALAGYAGDLLPALHVADAELFDKWLSSERTRLRTEIARSAALLADRRANAGDVAGAIDAARRCSELDPDDEIAARRWIALLDLAGDKAQAFAVYQRFRNHLSTEFGVRPSVETVALLEAVRTRRDGQPMPANAALTPSAVGVSDSTREPDGSLAVVDQAKLPPAQSVASEVAVRRTTPVSPVSRRRLWFVLGSTAALGMVVVLVGVHGAASTAGVANQSSKTALGASVSPILAVLPMENETGDPKQAYLAAGLAEGVARRLEGMGGLTIRSGARSELPIAVRHDFKSIGHRFGSTILLRTILLRAGDSLEVRASVIDAETSGERAVAARRFTIAELRDVESGLAAAVAGEIFRVPMPAIPRPRMHSSNYRSDSLTLEAWHQQETVRNNAAAKRLFEQAVDADGSNARAFSGLSASWSLDVVTGAVPFAEGYDRSSAAAERALELDSLEGTAWANLGMLRALRYRNLSVGLELTRKAKAAEPGNQQVYLVEQFLYRSAWQWDLARDAIRVVRRLDPLNSYHLEREATIELCAGRAAAAVALYATELEMDPSDTIAQIGQVRALARLGRFDEALTSWRQYASEIGDTSLVTSLQRARGETGFWSVTRFDASRRLQQFDRRGKRGWTSPLKRMQLLFESGDIEGGYSALEALAREHDPLLFRLPCMPSLDVVRGSPRFEAIVARVGPMPLR